MLSATWYGCQDSDRLTWDEDEDGDEDEDDGDDDDNDNTADYDVVIVHLMFAYNCDYYVLAMIRLFAVRCCWLLIISHAGEMVTRGQGSLLLFVCCLQFFLHAIKQHNRVFMRSIVLVKESFIFHPKVDASGNGICQEIAIFHRDDDQLLGKCKNSSNGIYM